MSELAKLRKRLFETKGRTTLNFDVFWGEEAYKLNLEERAAVINRVLDAVARGEAVRTTSFPECDKVVDVRQFVKDLNK